MTKHGLFVAVESRCEVVVFVMMVASECAPVAQAGGLGEVVQGLSRDEMRELADHFAAQKPAPQNFKADPAKAVLGKKKADETLCTMCHLGGFAGQNEIPRVAGQHYDYIVRQLRDFKARKRTNDAGNMTSVSNTLSDADIENLAHYIVGL